MTNLITVNDFVLDAFNPTALAKGIALRMRKRRLELNLTQMGLATKAGVTLGSLKRFENSFEVSLKHLLMIAVVLDATETFGELFSIKQYQSIDEMLSASSPKKRQRGKRND